MSHIKRLIIKIGVVSLVAWGGYNWVYQTPEHAKAVTNHAQNIVNITEKKADSVIDTTSEWVDENSEIAQRTWKRADFESVADKIQDRAKPLRTSMIKTMRPVTSPVAKSAIWLDQKMSLVAVAFMLIAASMIAVMVVSSSNSQE